jgi:hypothetical protein
MSKRTRKRTTVDAIKASINKKPLKAIRLCQSYAKTGDAGYHRRLRSLLAFAFQLSTDFVSRDGQHWEEFRKLPFWTKRNPAPDAPPDKIILFVCRYIWGAAATDGSAYNRAHKYARILTRYFFEPVHPDDVAARLEEDGGVEVVYELEVEENPRRTGKELEPDAENDDEVRPRRPRETGGNAGNSRTQPKKSEEERSGNVDTHFGGSNGRRRSRQRAENGGHRAS